MKDNTWGPIQPVMHQLDRFFLTFQNTWKDRQRDRQIDRQTGSQAGRQTDKQIGRQVQLDLNKLARVNPAPLINGNKSCKADMRQ